MFRWMPCVLALCVIPLAAWADRVTLKNGQVYEGKLVSDEGEEMAMDVLVMGRQVRVTIPFKDIEKHEKTVSLKEQYEARLGRTNRKDADALADLAAWCADNGWTDRAGAHDLEAVAINPAHAPAIRGLRALGYVQVDGKWLPEPEAKRAQGLERWGDQWLPKAEVAALRARADAQEKAKSEESRKQLQAATLGRGVSRVNKDLAAVSSEYEQRVQERNREAGRLEEANARAVAVEESAAPHIVEARSLNAEADRVYGEVLARTRDRDEAKAVSRIYEVRALEEANKAKDILKEARKIRDEAAGYEQRLKAIEARMRALEQEYEKKDAEARKLMDRQETLKR